MSGFAVAGGYSSAPIVVLSTEMDGLASSSGDVLAVSAPQVNSLGAPFADLELAIGGACSPVADAFVEIWVLRSIDGGTRYEDGTATMAPARPPDATIAVASGTNITPRAGEPQLTLPPANYKIAIRNQMGVAMPAGSILRIAPYGEGTGAGTVAPPGDVSGPVAFRIGDMLERFGVVTYSQSSISVNPWGAGTSDYTTDSVIAAVNWMTANSGLAMNIREYHVAGRDTGGGSNQLTWCPTVFEATGAHFDVSLQRGAVTADATSLGNMATNSANGEGWMSWAEGLNTPNDGSVTAANCVAVQQALYTAVTGTNNLPHPVTCVGPSFTYNTLPPDTSTAVTGYLSTTQKANLIAASPTASVRFFPTANPEANDSAGRGGNFDDVAIGHTVYFGKPEILGEFHPTQSNADSPSRASDDSYGAYYGVLMMLNAHRLGFDAWFWKSLFDIGRSGESPWTRVGLFPNSGSDTPRLPARAIRAMYALTGDPGSSKRTFQPSRLDYSISGLPSPPASATPWMGGHHRLYQNSGGTFFLFVWNEQFFPGGSGTTVTITFGRTMARVLHYDLTTDATTAETAVSSQTNIASLSFSLTASVHLFVIYPQGSVIPTESAQDTTLSSTAGVIYDSLGVAWTLVSNPPFGLQVSHGGLVDGQNIILLLYHDHAVHRENNAGTWEYWNNATSAWVSEPRDPRVTVSESADGTIVNTTTGTIYASQTVGQPPGANLDAWTLTSGALVAKNGVSDASTFNAMELYYHNHTVFLQRTVGNSFGTPGWSFYNGSTWTDCVNPFGIVESSEGTQVSTVGPTINASATPGQTSTNLHVFSLSAAPIGSGLPSYDHIVMVVLENKDFTDLVGNSSAPYINGTLIGGGRLLTNYFAISHPSEPNYLALYFGSDFGVTDDNVHAQATPDLYTVLNAAGKTFIGYDERPTATPLGKHDPWRFATEGTSVERDFVSFPTDFNTLPKVCWVIPNQADDMHDGTIAQGDAWLQAHIDPYAQWAKSNNSLLIVTTDEDASNTTNRVMTLLYGAHVIPGQDSVTYNHYSTLASTCVMAGLAQSAAPRNATSATLFRSSNFSSGQQVIFDGVTDTSTSDVTLLYYHNHSLYYRASITNSFGNPGWWVWVGPGMTNYNATPNPLQLNATESTEGTTVTTAGAIIYASQTPGQVAGPALDQWTLTTGGQISWNGSVLADSAGVIELYYSGHYVYQESTFGNALGYTPGWWRWDGTNWIDVAPPTTPAQQSIVIANIPQQITGSAFTVTGTLSGYSSPPSLQYRDGSGSWVAFPAGSPVTATSFAFTHPAMTAPSSGAPAPAAAVGFNTRTAGPNATLGVNWFPWNVLNPSGNTGLPDLTVNSDGSITDNGAGPNFFNHHVTTVNSDSTGSLQGVAFGGGGYYEMTFSFPGDCADQDGGNGWVAFWLNGAENKNNYGLWSFFPSIANDEQVEYDAAEFGKGAVDNYGAGIINWNFPGGGNYNNLTNNQSGVITIPGVNFGQRHRYGFLHVKATSTSQGYIKNYFDGQQVGDTYTWGQHTGWGSPPFSIMDVQHLMFIFGTGTRNPMTVYAFEAWQASDSQNFRGGVALPTGSTGPTTISVRDAGNTNVQATSNVFNIVASGSVTLSDITLSGNTLVSGAVAGTQIGTITVVVSGGVFNGTLAVNDTSHFRISGSVLQNSTTLTVGNYPITITATMSGASASPMTRNFTISVSGSGNSSINFSAPTGKTLKKTLFGFSSSFYGDQSGNGGTFFENATFRNTANTWLKPSCLSFNADWDLDYLYSIGDMTRINNLLGNYKSFCQSDVRVVMGVCIHPDISPSTRAANAANFARYLAQNGHSNIMDFHVGILWDRNPGWPQSTVIQYFNAVADALHGVNPNYKVWGPAQWDPGEFADATFGNQVGTRCDGVSWTSYDVSSGSDRHITDSLNTAYVAKGINNPDAINQRNALAGTPIANVPLGTVDWNMSESVSITTCIETGTYIGGIYAACYLMGIFKSTNLVDVCALQNIVGYQSNGTIGSDQQGGSLAAVSATGYFLGKAGQTLFGPEYTSVSTIANLSMLAVKPTPTTFAIWLINYDTASSKTLTLSISGGVPTGTISRWELGKSSPGAPTSPTPITSTQSSLTSISIPSETIVILTGQLA